MGTELSKNEKWHAGIDATSIGDLSAIATKIEKAVDDTVKHVARGKIKIGKLLLEARERFESDVAFGKWRREQTEIRSKQHAHYLMQVAERFGDAPKLIEGANYSVLQELVTAEDKDIKWVEAKIDEGKPPKVVEVREKVNETKELKGTSKKGNVQPAKPGTIVKSTTVPNADLNKIVQQSLTLRVQWAEGKTIDMETALVILGMDPDPQTPCNPEVLDWIAEMWLRSTNDETEEGIVQKSYEHMVAEFGDWD